jgi:gentisate 1,2-dioxygenase
VEGERVMMKPGDFVTTPNWAWHDHGNVGSEPVVWLDGLDLAFANLFGAHFREEYPQESQPVSRAEGDAGARYGANLLPLEYHPKSQASPLLSYPYDRTREALERLARGGDPHPAHGYKLRYVNPATGGHPFPTMAVFMQWLPKGYAGQRARSTDGAVYCVVEGHGNAVIGETRLDFSPHDVFVVPSWEPSQFRADADCVLFSYSDRAAQEALGFWREEAAWTS